MLLIDLATLEGHPSEIMDVLEDSRDDDLLTAEEWCSVPLNDDRDTHGCNAGIEDKHEDSKAQLHSQEEQTDQPKCGWLRKQGG